MNSPEKINADNIEDYEYHSYKDKIEEWRKVLVIKGFSKANIAALSDQEIENLINEIDIKDIDDGF